MVASDNLALASIVGAAAAFLFTFLLTPRVAAWMKSRGIVGQDVHKLEKPLVPEMGGLALLAGISAGCVVLVVLIPGLSRGALAFLASLLVAGAIGVVDDLRPLGARLKPALTAISGVPIVVLGAYSPFPELPFIGHARMTVVYPFLVLIALAVTSNAANMLDVLNGAMTGSFSIVTGSLLLVLVFSGRWDVASMALVLLASLLAFHAYNRFPAKVFSGDTGSLAVGAAAGALAVIGQVEVVAIVAMIPHIMNAFYGLSSVGGLYERREIKQRPIRLRGDARLEATDEPGAPVTLIRLLLAAGPLPEKQVVRNLLVLGLVSAGLALITFAVTRVGT